MTEITKEKFYDKKKIGLLIILLIIFSNLKSGIGNNNANNVLQYEIEIVSDVSDCPDYSSIFENFTQKLQYSVPSNKENFGWTSTLMWDTNSTFDGMYPNNQVIGNMDSFNENWDEFPKYPFQLLFTCINIDEYINTILNLELIYPSYDNYEEIVKRSYPKDIITKMGISTSINKFDFGIQSKANLRKGYDYNGSTILGMSESSRLIGHFTEP